MQHSSQTSPTAASDETWQEIELLVEEIASLSKSPLPLRQFYSELLSRAVASLAAVGGAIWTVTADGQLELTSHVNFQHALDDSDPENQRQHARLIAQAIHRSTTTMMAPSSGDRQASNPTPYVLLLAPVSIENEPAALIEIMQRSGASPATQAGYVRLVTALAELAAEFHQNQQLRQLRQRQGDWTQCDQFARRIHASLDVRKTAYTIANDGRHLVGCERLSVLIARSSRCRVTAISGVDTFDRRSRVVRLQEKLARLVMRTDEPLWYDEQSPSFAPEIEGPLQEYLDASRSRMLAVIPLGETIGEGRRQKTRRLGVLVAENFEAGLSDGQRDRIAVVAGHSRVALVNALDVRSIPLMPLWQALARVGWLMRLRQLPKTLAVLGSLAAIIAALVFVKTDFAIEARGRLQPAVRQYVFAPSDGVVNKLNVQHGSEVHAGEPLAVLRDPQLDLEFKRLWGETETARKRLAAIEAGRLLDLPGDTGSRAAEQQRLTAEEEELKERLRGLADEQKILEEQRSQLTIVSPIDGQVLTWDVRGLLEARPVRRGQTLLTVADLNGPWVLEVHVPDDQVGHVLSARDQLRHDLEVQFALETEPGKTHSGHVERLAISTDTSDREDLSVMATIEFDRQSLGSAAEGMLRPGAGAVAHVYCGQRSIGYVWFRGLWEAVQRWWF